MHYLIYVSQAARLMDEKALGEILSKSRDYNTRDEITGLLIYKQNASGSRANFMQMLEGEKKQLDDAFRRICDDERHHTKVVLEEGKMDARHFPEWTMGFRNVETLDLENFDGFTDLGSDSFWQRANAGGIDGALELMLSFYDD